MGLSMYACMVPGRTRSSEDSSTVGWVTETVGMARVSVSLAKAWNWERRWNRVRAPTTTRTTATLTMRRKMGLFFGGRPSWDGVWDCSDIRVHSVLDDGDRR